MLFSSGHNLKCSADAVEGAGTAPAAPNYVREKDRELVLEIFREALEPSRGCQVITNFTGGVQLEGSRFVAKELGLTRATHSALELGLIDETVVEGLRAIAVEQPRRYQALLESILAFSKEVSWRITVLESANGYTQHPDVAQLYKKAEGLVASPKITGDLFPRLYETLKAIKVEEGMRPKIEHHFPGHYDLAIRDLPLRERRSICEQIGKNLNSLESWIVPACIEIGGFAEYKEQVNELLSVFETDAVIPSNQQTAHTKAFAEGIQTSLAKLSALPLREGIPAPASPEQLSELVSNWRSLKSIGHEIMQLRGNKRIAENGVHGL
jgi:hypothetical protein